MLREVAWALNNWRVYWKKWNKPISKQKTFYCTSWFCTQ